MQVPHARLLQGDALMGDAREQLRREAFFAKMRDYESGADEIVSDVLPSRPCTLCQTPCRAVGANPLCASCLPSPPKNRLRRTP